MDLVHMGVATAAVTGTIDRDFITTLGGRWRLGLTSLVCRHELTNKVGRLGNTRGDASARVSRDFRRDTNGGRGSLVGLAKLGGRWW
eukprot:2646561-Ditylum_brightwellii.AAC.1